MREKPVNIGMNFTRLIKVTFLRIAIGCFWSFQKFFQKKGDKS